MRKKILYIICFATIFTSNCAFADLADTTFWKKTYPKEIPAEALNEKHGDAVIIEDNRLIVYDKYNRKITRHKIVYNRTQEGLSKNNKVVIYLPGSSTIEDIRARSINPDGSVVELNKNNIKEKKDYTKDGNLKMFAIEGGQVGGRVEYTYTIKTPLYDSGKERLSFNYKTLHSCVIIACDEVFKIDSKAFNWRNMFESDATEHKYVFTNILPISEEKYSTPRANRVEVEHKLIGSTYKESTFASYKNVLKFLKRDLTYFVPAEYRKMKSLLKKFEGNEGNSLQTVRNLDSFLKSRFFYEDNFRESKYANVISVMNSRSGNDKGLVKLYGLALGSLGVKYEIYITCDKYDSRLLEDYCSRFTLTEFLIYLPDFNTYMYPSSQVMHVGIIPSWIVGNKALVVNTNLEDKRVRFVTLKSEESKGNEAHVDLQVDMNLNENTTVYKLTGVGKGQIAFGYNYDIFYADSESQIQEELKSYVAWRYPEGDILKIEMNQPEQWGDISFCDNYECERSYNATVKSSNFFEQIGDKLLLNVGSLIGPQNELYSELDRVQDIVNSYNKKYSFDIQIKIPEGYEFMGAENLEINNSFTKPDGTEIAGFMSNYEVENGNIIIHIREFYAQVNIDKKFYQEFRKIINSAADYNKATVLLRKKV